MVTVLPEQGTGGDPPIFPVGCAGFIAAHQKLADGRYDLVLQGTRRFRILEEEPPDGERLYRVASVEWIEDPGAGKVAEAADKAQKGGAEKVDVIVTYRAMPDAAAENARAASLGGGGET